MLNYIYYTILTYIILCHTILYHTILHYVIKTLFKLYYLKMRNQRTENNSKIKYILFT